MKKLLMIAAMAAIGFSPAMALPAGTSVGVGGSEPAKCEITNAPTSVVFSTFTDSFGSANAQNFTVDVYCNTVGDVKMTSTNGYLKLDTTDASYDSVSETDFTSGATSQFAAGMDYTFAFPPSTVLFTSAALTAGVDLDFQIPPLNYPATTLTFDTDVDTATALPLLGGSYSDTLTVTITPAGL